MHLGIISRGSKRDIDRFIEELQAKYVPIKVKGLDMSCNIVYRPIQLGEIIFPEPLLNQVLKTLEPMNWKRKGLHFEFLRRMLKLEKVPKIIDDKTKPFPIWAKNFELNLLGIKRDKYSPEGYEML